MTKYKYQYVLDALKVLSNEASVTEISLAFVGASVADFSYLHCLKDYGFNMAYEVAFEIENDLHRGISVGAIHVFRACFEEERGGDELGMVWIKSDAVDVSRLDQYRKVTFNDLVPIVEYVAGCIGKRGDAWSSQLAAVAAQKPSVSKGMRTSEKIAFELNALQSKYLELKSKWEQANFELNALKVKYLELESKAKQVDEQLSDDSFSGKKHQLSRSVIMKQKEKPASRNKARVFALWLALVARDGYKGVVGRSYKEFSGLPEMKELRSQFQDGAYADSTMEKDFSGWNTGKDDAFNPATLELLEEMLARLASPAAQLAASNTASIELPKIVSEVLKGRDVVKRIVAALGERGRSLPGIIPVTSVTPQ